MSVVPGDGWRVGGDQTLAYEWRVRIAPTTLLEGRAEEQGAFPPGEEIAPANLMVKWRPSDVLPAKAAPPVAFVNRPVPPVTV